jgi:Ras-related protein Rab-32
MFLIHQVSFIGLQGPGKTSIIKRFVHNFFTQRQKKTISVDFHQKSVSLDDETKLRLELYEPLLNILFKNAKGIFLVYDVTQPVEQVLKWKSYFDQFNSQTETRYQ